MVKLNMHPIRPLVTLNTVAMLFICIIHCSAQDTPSKPTVIRDAMVEMRDGVKLATDVYLPFMEGSANCPAILVRSPYDKAGSEQLGHYFSRHGYAFVAQDTRGRYGSEGTWHWLTDDGKDGVDTVAWIAEQTWSNKSVAMTGTSYSGGTQHALAMEGSPHLKAVIPVDAVSNMAYSGMRNGGAFELRFWNWIMLAAGRGSQASRDPAVAIELKTMADSRLDYLANLPLRSGMTPLRLAPEYEDWLIQAMKHGADDVFWSQNNIIRNASQYQDIPVLLIGGWYDSWSSSTTASYSALARSKRKSPVNLIMGPWIHGAQDKSSHGQVEFGAAASLSDHLNLKLAWYDRWLKTADKLPMQSSNESERRVKVFVMGTGDGHRTENGLLFHGGEWREEAEWPPQRATETALYLQPGGHLNWRASSSSDPLTSSTAFQYDPNHPVPTIGGNISSGNDILLQGGWNQVGGPHIWNWKTPLPISARNDVIVYQTEPLNEDFEVTGELRVELWVSSDCLDTDFTAKLIDAYPPSSDFPAGFALNISDGIKRLRFRNSLEREEEYKPHSIVQLTITLSPTSNVFKKGHQIRLDISSSNFPRFDLNPNTGEPLNEHRTTRVAVNRVYHSSQRQSKIILPHVSE